MREASTVLHGVGAGALVVHQAPSVVLYMRLAQPVLDFFSRRENIRSRS